MADKIIGIITHNENDISDLLAGNGIKTRIMRPGEILADVLEGCYAIAILAGTEKEALILAPAERILIENQLKKGKKVFSEFCNSLGFVYSQEPSSTRFDRLCFVSEDVSVEGLALGDILDDQCNTRVKPWDITCSKNRPLLQYVKVNVHNQAEVTEELLKTVDERAIWFEQENLLFCALRMCNFIKGRFSPKDKWKSLVRYILEWLCDEKIDTDCLKDTYELHRYNHQQSFTTQLAECITHGMAWFEKADLLIGEGKGGIKEGLATEIYPDGSQRMLMAIRHDCIGEVSFAYFLKYYLDKNKRNLEISKKLSSVCFDLMQVKEDGPFKGMMRWTNQAWAVCYQDDDARALIPELLKCLYTGEKHHLDDCVEALNFLVSTTGPDGTRIMRTDIKDLNAEVLKKLATEPGNYPSAHYNAYYLAALLLAYKLTKNEAFREVGIKGMETIMSVYPNTIREHSETQELCRLVLPLAYLYWITGEEKHKAWLYKVAGDLQRFRHASGGYVEWDTGYQSSRFGTNGDECSLLTKNGDPVVDMLYSINWLPSAFIQAYFITGDRYFKDLWEDIAKFMISAQVHSGNAKINGGWTRAMDVDKMEVFGLPNDLGWGPWAMETGWTVAEILFGLSLGLLEDEIGKFYL